MNKKIVRICVSIILTVAILFTIGILILKYQVEGETNLPFNISKITIISTSEGVSKESENEWDFNINQNNDIYIYIDRNKDYNKIEVIDSILLDNFQITRKSNFGQNTIYMPQNEGTSLIKNEEKYKAEKIEYKGDLESDIKNLKISNQGGILVFRYSIENLREYISNTDEEIKHQELLKKTGVEQKELQSQLTFDITIKLNSKKSFKATVNLNTPSGNVIENGTTNQEITELENIVFKRIEN